MSRRARSSKLRRASWTSAGGRRWGRASSSGRSLGPRARSPDEAYRALTTARLTRGKAKRIAERLIDSVRQASTEDLHERFDGLEERGIGFDFVEDVVPGSGEEYMAALTVSRSPKEELLASVS